MNSADVIDHGEGQGRTWYDFYARWMANFSVCLYEKHKIHTRPSCSVNILRPTLSGNISILRFQCRWQKSTRHLL